MRFAILYSKKDEAGKNIARQLKNFYLPHIPIIELSKESIYSENIDKELEELKNIDFIVFATKHQSKEARNTLSLHAPGNWKNADFGGKPGKICKTSSNVLKFLLQEIDKNLKESNLNYELTLECTHHGPLIEKPCCFIDIGTTKEQWNDESAGKIIAKTLSELQKFDNWKKENKELKHSIGIGGPHYCPNFNKVQLNSKEIGISHIIPEYQMPINESMIKEAIEKTQEHVNLILLDWKGCGKSEERQKVISIAEKLGLKIMRA